MKIKNWWLLPLCFIPAGILKYGSNVLRDEAIKAMDGMAWYFGAIQINFILHAPEITSKRTLLDYMGGIMDTLDGSCGSGFTYLPIVFEADCQIASSNIDFQKSKDIWYTL